MACDSIPLGAPVLDPFCAVGGVVSAKYQEWMDTVEKWFADALAAVMRATATAWTSITTPGITIGDPKNGNPSATVELLMNLTAYVSASLVLVGIIWSMGRMAVTGEAEHGKDAAKGFIRWIVVTGLAAGIVGTLVLIADGLSDWIIMKSTGSDFGAGLLQMVKDTGGLVFILLVIIAILGILVNVVQIALLIWRGGALIVLTGVIGVMAAASTLGERGKATYQHACGWILAYVLYKPVAALFYAAAFKLMTDQAYPGDDTKTIEHITGIALMFLALLALPAMLRLVTPLVSQVAGGKGLGGALGAAAMVALPSGAMMLASKGASGAAAAGGGGGGAPTGATGGPSGGGGGSGGAAPTPSPAPSGSSGGGGSAAPAPSGGGSSGGGIPGGAVAAAFRGGSNPNAQRPPGASASAA